MSGEGPLAAAMKAKGKAEAALNKVKELSSNIIESGISEQQKAGIAEAVAEAESAVAEAESAVADAEEAPTTAELPKIKEAFVAAKTAMVAAKVEAEKALKKNGVSNASKAKQASNAKQASKGETQYITVIEQAGKNGITYTTRVQSKGAAAAEPTAEPKAASKGGKRKRTHKRKLTHNRKHRHHKRTYRKRSHRR